MKRFILICFMLVGVMGLSSSLGILAGQELGGRNRFFIGLKADVGDTLRFGVDMLYPVSSISSVAEEISEIQTLEVDLLVLLSINISDFRVYAGGGPIMILDLETFTTNFYSLDTFRMKVGGSYKLGDFSVFIETSTLFTYQPTFMLGNVYAVQGGIALGF